MTTRRAIIVVDMGFGDAGKGATVDHLCATGKVDVVCRYSGGCQASHRVVMADGREHRFSQFGSGTLRDIPTFLGSSMIIDPLAMRNEAMHLKAIGVGEPYDLLRVAPDCLVATPYHKLLNRIEEAAAGHRRHGSCGMGIGATRSYWLQHGLDAIRASDIGNGELEHKLLLLKNRLAEKVRLCARIEKCREMVQEFLRLTPHEISRRMADAFCPVVLDHFVDANWQFCVMEGSQGILLDQDLGFPPHHTWSDVTSRPAEELLTSAGCDDYKILGCVRSFTTRHGAGPLPGHDPDLTASLIDPGNPENEWQGALRCSPFDMPLFDYATHVQRVDGLAVSWLDKYPGVVVSDHEVSVNLIHGTGMSLAERLQSSLSATLARAEAVRTKLPKEAFLGTIGNVVVKGFGPTAEDRVVSEEWEEWLS
jgi:adenylosuccinate synthase